MIITVEKAGEMNYIQIGNGKVADIRQKKKFLVYKNPSKAPHFLLDKVQTP